MIYLWEIPENFSNRDTGEYDRNLSPDRFLLRRGSELNADEFSPTPIVDFEVSQKRLLKFDCLPNNSSIPLVNNRVIKSILENLAPNEVQFFPAKVLCSDGELRGYFFLNVIAEIIGIDHEKSVYTNIETIDKVTGKRIVLDAISGFTYLTYNPGCMGKYHLARDKEYHGNLLVSEKLKVIFDKEKITGVWLVPPEEFYP
jgi:hypothetical protein